VKELYAVSRSSRGSAGDARRLLPADPAVSLQGKALGDPTRYAIFAHLLQADEPVLIADLITVFPFNYNAIRKHLSQLRDAGLVVEERSARAGLGRPPLTYRASPGAIDRWALGSPNEELALMLVEMIQSGRPAREVGRDAGARLAAQGSSVAEGSRDAVTALEGVTRRLGFEPLRRTGPNGLELVLQRCPFSAAVRASAEIVCELHRGLADGVCQESGGTVTVTELRVGTPGEGECVLQLAT